MLGSARLPNLQYVHNIKSHIYICLIKLMVPTKIIFCAMMKMIKGCKCADYYQCIQMSVETFHFFIHNSCETAASQDALYSM